MTSLTRFNKVTQTKKFHDVVVSLLSNCRRHKLSSPMFNFQRSVSNTKLRRRPPTIDVIENYRECHLLLFSLFIPHLPLRAALLMSRAALFWIIQWSLRSWQQINRRHWCSWNFLCEIFTRKKFRLHEQLSFVIAIKYARFICFDFDCLVNNFRHNAKQEQNETIRFLINF